MSNPVRGAAITAAICAQLIAGCLPCLAEGETVVKISAKKYEYTPNEIVLKKGVPVILQLTSEDRHHGFNIPSMNIRADIEPGKVTEVKIDPQQVGDIEFHCDVFCGGGHETMCGTFKVQE